jgi:TRAP-type C4-dicarboxylate transport system substrate-binding protein
MKKAIARLWPAWLLVLSHPAGAQVFNFGTIAPEGTPWHQLIQRMGQDWRRISGGKVTVRIYAGGVQGDEPEMIQRVRLGQLHGLMISSVGLPYIERAVQTLQVPLLIQSNEELDYVVDKVRPKLEQMLREKGFVVLNWGDVGWVHFFTKRGVPTLAEIKQQKLLIGAGDPDSEILYKEFGFRVVPLAYTDMLMGLRTGMVEAFQVPPLFALANQSFALAGHMIELKWAPIIGATVISAKSWERVPEAMRGELLEAARSAGARVRGEIRKLGTDAVSEMEKRGLQVVRLDARTRAAWQSETESGWTKLRGRWAPADLFDEVLRLRNEFRKAHPGGPAR